MLRSLTFDSPSAMAVGTDDVGAATGRGTVKIVRYDDIDPGECDFVMTCVSEPADEITDAMEKEYRKYEAFVQELREKGVDVKHVKSIKDLPRNVHVTNIPDDFGAVNVEVPLSAPSVPLVRQPGQITSPASPTYVESTGVIKLSDLTIKVKNTTSTISVSGLKDFTLLLVNCKPYFFKADQVPSDRSFLDTKVKNLLILSTAKFTEWLIKERLARSVQYCEKHSEGIRQVNGVFTVKPQEMQLAMYAEAQKFPSTGGYVWISPCCPNRYVSVFRGSIFEGANAAPVVVLKLIYHWACQTSATNICHWVKVEYGYVDKFFRTMRALCTYYLVNSSPRLGGSNCYVEATAATVQLQHKLGTPGIHMTFDLIGLYDRQRKEFRFRTLIWTKNRGAAIRKVLSQYVHPGSKLVIDSSLNYSEILENVVEISNIEIKTPPMNKVIMTYVHAFLRQFLFENGFKIKTLLDMQSVLDELAWRETYGQTPLMAFDNITGQLGTATERLQAEKNLKHGKMEGIVNKLQAVQSMMGTDSLYSRIPLTAEDINSEPPAAPPAAVTVPRMPGPRSSTSTIKIAPTKSVSSSMGTSGSGSRNLQQLLMKQRQETPEMSYCAKPSVQAPIKLGRPRSQAKPKSKKKGNAADTTQEYVDIQGYYYSTVDPEIEDKMDMDDSHYECNLCQKKCESVFRLGLHVFMHLLGGNYSGEADEGLLCKYCLQSFPTDFALQNHISGHQNPYDGIRCAICQEFFKSTITLIQHMVKLHNPSEMPYACSICPYRTSFHKAYIEHFEEKHSRGDKALCNYCLKTFSIFPNLKVFVTHVQLHLQQIKKIKCKKCSLVFVNQKQQKAHKRDHISRAGQPDVVKLEVAVAERLMMAKPSDDDENRKVVFKSSVDQVGVDAEVTLGMKCLECGKPFRMGEHFLSTYNCNRCSFETMCSDIASDHIRKCLGGGIKAHARKKKPALLPFKYYCPCGFISNDGDRIATHLGEDCEFDAVYETAEKARNSIPENNVTFAHVLNCEEEESNQTWISAFIKSVQTTKEQEKAQGVLGMVGLVRKRDGIGMDDGDSSTTEGSEPMSKRGRYEEEGDEESKDGSVAEEGGKRANRSEDEEEETKRENGKEKEGKENEVEETKHDDVKEEKKDDAEEKTEEDAKKMDKDDIVEKKTEDDAEKKKDCDMMEEKKEDDADGKKEDDADGKKEDDADEKKEDDADEKKEADGKEKKKNDAEEKKKDDAEEKKEDNAEDRKEDADKEEKEEKTEEKNDDAEEKKDDDAKNKKEDQDEKKEEEKMDVTEEKRESGDLQENNEDREKEVEKVGKKVDDSNEEEDGENMEADVSGVLQALASTSPVPEETAKGMEGDAEMTGKESSVEVAPEAMDVDLPEKDP